MTVINFFYRGFINILVLNLLTFLSITILRSTSTIGLWFESTLELWNILSPFSMFQTKNEKIDPLSCSDVNYIPPPFSYLILLKHLLIKLLIYNPNPNPAVYLEIAFPFSLLYKKFDKLNYSDFFIPHPLSLTVNLA